MDVIDSDTESSELELSDSCYDDDYEEDCDSEESSSEEVEIEATRSTTIIREKSGAVITKHSEERIVITKKGGRTINSAPKNKNKNGKKGTYSPEKGSRGQKEKNKKRGKQDFTIESLDSLFRIFIKTSGEYNTYILPRGLDKRESHMMRDLCSVYKIRWNAAPGRCGRAGKSKDKRFYELQKDKSTCIPLDTYQIECVYSKYPSPVCSRINPKNNNNPNNSSSSVTIKNGSIRSKKRGKSTVVDDEMNRFRKKEWRTNLQTRQVLDHTIVAQHAEPISDGRGMKMLLAMGWTPGTGIGAKQEGILEPLTAVVKNNKRGIGYNRHAEELL